jgi:Mrp family chromosome partitioning ATPase
MTRTNQAFIKAYRQDVAQAAPAPPSKPNTVAKLVPATTRIPPSPEPSAQPAATVASERSALYGPRIAKSESSEVSTSRSANAPAEKQPLSSFITRPLKTVRVDSSGKDEFLRPGTTVASFHWPAVCRVLKQKCDSQLKSVVQQLVDESSAGRSLIGVLGLFAGCGTTTTALCLAATLAADRHRVILVDGNFSNPQLASSLEVVPTAGWQDVLKHGGALADAVTRAADDHLDLLALNNRKTEDAQRLLGGLQTVVTAGVLRHAYDVVLFDCGSFFEAASQPIALELIRNTGIDAVVAVAGPEPADARDLENLHSHLSRSGCELLGTIENRIAKPHAA